MSQLRIALTGRRGSGKTTVAQTIANLHQSAAHISTSDIFVEMAADMANGLCVDDYFGNGHCGPIFSTSDVIANKEKWRPFLQWIGGDYLEIVGLGRSAHIPVAIRRAIGTGKDVVVVESLREKEQEHIARASGFVIVKITNPLAYPDEDVDNHVSETDVDLIKPDLTVFNTREQSPAAIARMVVEKAGEIAWERIVDHK